jgi:S-(hydroxymethyl)glutathione dehydrogenase/alcohol dehydrogenase
MEKAYEMTPNDGKTIFVGVPNNKISIYSLPLAFNKILKVSHGGTQNQIKIFQDILNLINNKKINFNNL